MPYLPRKDPSLTSFKKNQKLFSILFWTKISGNFSKIRVGTVITHNQVYRVPSEFEVSKSLVTLKFHGYHESLMGYRRVCGGFRRMPKPPQISAVTHQISHGNQETFKVTKDLRPQISLGILVPQILMCYQQTLRPSNLREITQPAVSNKILAL